MVETRRGAAGRGRGADFARRAVHGLGVRASRVEWAAHRRLLAFGDRVYCPICGWRGLVFAASRKPRRMNRLCPQCMSSERDRALHMWLARRSPMAEARLLEVAPIGLVKSAAKRLGYSYTSMDLSSARAEVLTDLCRLSFHDETFDVVVCFHVLEHVPSDLEAVEEIGRVLTRGGNAVVSVPWDRTTESTDEDLMASPEERQRRFGQSDHVRMYGRDLPERLRRSGMAVDEVLWRDYFSAEEFRRSALAGDDDRFWICRTLA